MTSLIESELLEGATAHSSRHEGNEVSERSRGGYPSGPDAILRYPGNEFVSPSDNRARIDVSEFEEGREVGDPVSARTRAKGSKPDSRLVSGERSQQSARHSQKQRFTVVDASNAEAATVRRIKAPKNIRNRPRESPLYQKVEFFSYFWDRIPSTLRRLR